MSYSTEFVKQDRHPEINVFKMCMYVNITHKVHITSELILKLNFMILVPLYFFSPYPNVSLPKCNNDDLL